MRVILSAMIMMLVAACGSSTLPNGQQHGLIHISDGSAVTLVDLLDSGFSGCWMEEGGGLSDYVLDGIEYSPSTRSKNGFAIFYKFHHKEDVALADPLKVFVLGFRTTGPSFVENYAMAGKQDPAAIFIKQEILKLERGEFVCGQRVSKRPISEARKAHLVIFNAFVDPDQLANELDAALNSCWTADGGPQAGFTYNGRTEEEAYNGMGKRYTYMLSDGNGEYKLTTTGMTGRKLTKFAVSGADPLTFPLFGFVKDQIKAFENSGTPFCGSPAS